MTNLRGPKERQTLAKMLMRLFDLWELTLDEQSQILGHAANISEIDRYRDGEPLDDNEELLIRAGILLGIHKSLRMLYPRNDEIAYRWISYRNKAFGNRRPLDVIIEEGVAGLRSVDNYLLRLCNH
ncbi:Protein of unknown function [Malonomonas rubra DSM 5091]|uniref:Antitoxin Xre/MbcA/ParS-like toxin-binding domain-containing protein n=1 Tax=Malonomonas rubra DSM 5091 TaxID=1122189 RepID=A0A1M6MY76_MALRU|nr:MbcA/ParS/Xre antitoxin family protein [Malonomonas rubra]SHJ88461.1 Protein of unknown function [Malonomonas rubra DSM 5091]